MNDRQKNQSIWTRDLPTWTLFIPTALIVMNKHEMRSPPTRKPKPQPFAEAVLPESRENTSMASTSSLSSPTNDTAWIEEAVREADEKATVASDVPNNNDAVLEPKIEVPDSIQQIFMAHCQKSSEASPHICIQRNERNYRVFVRIRDLPGADQALSGCATGSTDIFPDAECVDVAIQKSKFE